MKLRTALLLVAVASFISLPQSNAAFITHTATGTYNTAVSGLTNVGSTGFDSDSVGNKANPFNSGGISFIGSTLIAPVGPLTLAVRNDVGPNNTLGTEGTIGDFQGAPSPDFGDVLTINVPAGSRALGLHVLATPIDFLNFARLSIGGTSIDLFAGQPGVNVPGSPFSSYFLGISGTLASDTFTTASLRFLGGSFRVDSVSVYSAIPEPTSMALVAVAGIAGLVRRRARRV